MIDFGIDGPYVIANECSTGNMAPCFNHAVMNVMSKQESASAADGSKFSSVTCHVITGDAFDSSGGS
jgi:hypothetical protein